ncbi:nonribosomal peptide synthase, putative [Aspergillus udagawae]|uniref:Nonribosomal peptide synthase, putative n=1 Tax=Aspergillus udagawae TaxID=91492 RepID=A0A8H3SFA7_9EURO|nr:nonribosomal peptide synthase, putative [Aspergillus udagawae]
MATEQYSLFPDTNDRMPHPESAHHMLETEIDISKHVPQFCHQTQVQNPYFWTAVWAVILRQYTRGERVVMGFEFLKVGERGGKRQRQTLSASLVPNQRVSELFWPESWSLSPCTPAHRALFNTAIVIDQQDSFEQVLELEETCSIILVATNIDEHPKLKVRYKAATLSPGHAQLMRGYIIHAISSIIENPQQGIDDISTAIQRGQIQRWNSHEVAKRPCFSIHSLVHEQALLHPNKQSVHASDETFTYTELDVLSSVLAAHLQSLAIVPGKLVPVCFEKSAWAIVALLAVNKTGAAFVPLDPSHPLSRRNAILDMISPACMITSVQEAVNVPDWVPYKVVLSRQMMESLRRGREYQVPFSDPDNPAYCLFTSGSTGTPRGCVVGHAALSSVANHSQALRIGNQSRVLQFASFSFGISLIEIWSTLTAGGTICMPSEDDRYNRLAGAITDMQVDWALMTPTALQVLIPHQVPSLRTIGMAGEPPRRAQIEIWAKAVYLFQAYGLTEWAGICAVSEQIRTPESNSIIGRCAGGKLWLVDPEDHHRLAPIGAEAELLIEGPSLALEYLKEPGRTAEVFISTPSWMTSFVREDQQSPRLYRTGDLVRYQPDGSVAYLSRKGTLVKIRGQRVELGEVEYHIARQTPTVKKVIAEIVEPLDDDIHGRPTLAAFLLIDTSSKGPSEHGQVEEPWFIPADGKLRESIQALSSSLHEALPAYMVPDLFIPTRYVPVTVSGKVDRRRLRERAHLYSRERLVALTKTIRPSRVALTECEVQIQQWTAQVLNVPPERVRITDTFFDLGGDSVRAMKLVGLARQKHYHLKVADIFKYPRLVNLAELLDKRCIDQHAAAPRAAVKPFQLLKDAADEVTRNRLLLEVSTQCHVPPEDIEDIYPCTPMQEGLMALSANRTGAGVARFVFTLQRVVEIPRLLTAWQHVMNRNPVLRTRIVQTKANGLLQVVLRTGPVPLNRANDELETYLREVGAHSMATGDALLEAAFVNASREASFVITIHHALCDRWSMQLVQQQLEYAYLHQIAVAPTPSFATFISHTCVHQDEKQLREYWQRQFAGLDAGVLPAISSIQTPIADSQHTHVLRLSTDVHKGYTKSTLLQVAWAIVLANHTSSSDVVFGITVTGRGAAVRGVDQMAAPTIANVPLRVQLRPHETLLETLSKFQTELMEMIPFEQAGLQNIRRYSEETEAGCRFQSHLVVQPAWEDATSKSTLWSNIQADSTVVGGFAATALALVCSLNADGPEIYIQANFDARILPAERVRRMLDLFEAVVHLAVNNPETTLDGLPSVTDSELQRMKAWNERSPLTVTDTCIMDLLEQHFVQRPEHTAVRSWNGDFTFGELDRLSSKIAAGLVSQGLGAGHYVPIFLDRCKWTAVAMVAVIKAGAAFMLLDPAHPDDRLRYICTALRAECVISSKTMLPRCTTLGPQIAFIEKELNHEALTMVRRVQPHHALYAVFTSGSTGMPKAVVIEHRNFGASAVAHNRVHAVKHTSRVLHFASHAFDISIMETLSTLLAGACVCILSESERKDSFLDTANRFQITHAFLTPSLARTLDLSQLASLEVMIVGGEPLLPSDLGRLTGQRFRLVNEYGPAECAVTATAQHTVRSNSDPRVIGLPVGCRCWVVDSQDHQRLAPIGAEGELLIEGPIVGRGYLNDARRTAMSFIEPPNWHRRLYPDPSPMGRLYKTGDIVSHMEDGAIRIVGRKDLQVKVRGQRIELEEVQSHVKKCFPEVIDVVVELVSLGPQRTPSLVAFVCLRDGSRGAAPQGLILSPDASFRQGAQAALERLRSLIPSYLIPQLFLPVSFIPLGGTGKIDRRRLHRAAEHLTVDELQRHRQGDISKKPPSTPDERVLQEVWAHVLGLKRESVGVHDNFFYLGGDSIKAMAVGTCCRSKGLQLTVSQVFSHPILLDQAKLLSSATRSISAVDSPPFSLVDKRTKEALVQIAEKYQISPRQIEDIYPCTPLQEGLLASTARDSTAYVGQWVYQLPPHVDLSKLRKAWEHVASFHPILRTRMIQAPDNRLYQVVLCDPHIPWEVTEDFTESQMNKARQRMQLGRPLAYFMVCPGNETRRPRLHLTMHHASYDAISMTHIFRDIEASYCGQVTLTPRPFSPFIRFLQDEAAGHEDFWRQTFASLEAIPFPELPSVNYRPAPSSVIEQETTHGNITRQGSGTTLTTKILLAWAIVQSRYQRCRDVVFGVTVSGRSAPVPGIETMTGPTISTIPLRVLMDGEAPLAQMLQHVQDTRTNTIPHEHTGLQNIRRFGDDAQAACAFQTLLIVQQEEGEDVGMFQLGESLTESTAFSNYAILLSCHVHKNGTIKLQMSFDSQVVAERQMRRVLSYFVDVLAQIMNGPPNIRVQEVQPLSRSDKAEIISWNSRVPPVISHHCVHDIIQERCEQYPDAPAVCGWDGEFSYRELDALSSSLAQHLAAHAVHLETAVPLYFEKSRWTIVAIMAVLKAGGAFVLLDPSHPFKRLHTICEQLQAPVILVSETYSAAGASLCEDHIIVGEHHRQWTNDLAHWDAPQSRPQQALYIVFTSGSTGKPKGVVIEHGCYCTAAAAHIPVLNLSRFSRVLQFSAYAFDVSIMDILSTLMVGGCVCTLSEAQRRDGFVAAVQAMRTTHAMLTPSFARTIADFQELNSLEVLSLIGEKVKAVDVSMWADRVRFLNTYGPAECSVVSTIQDKITHQTNPSNIGFATGGTCWVVDPENHGLLAPIGAPGELVIEGALVARGYLNAPEKTAEVFIQPPPWLREARGGRSSRLYKTGDIVKYDSDGSLVYLGRKDSQAKVRGQRLELGEVETHVQQAFPGATDVVAEVIEFDHGQNALVAFVLRAECPAAGLLQPASDSFVADALQAETRLESTVPSYMIPAIYLPLSHMPYGASGKADRRQLRKMAAALSQQELQAYRRSSDGGEKRVTTEPERILRDVWSEILQLPASSIGAEDSFFRLGGDSIMAMKAAPLAREHGLRITVADIFDKPKLRDLAAVGTQHPNDVAGDPDQLVPPMALSPIQDPARYFECLRALGLVSSQAGLVDLFPCTEVQSFFLVRQTTHHYSFSISGTVDVDRLREACNAALRKHTILRTLFTMHNGQLIQVVLRGMELPFQHVTDLPNVAEFQQSLWQADATGNKVLPSLPTQFVLLSSHDKRHHTFVIRLLHAQWDAVSIPVLFNDIAVAYNDGSIPQGSVDYSAFLYERVQQPRDAALDFWRTLLKGSALTPLPPSDKAIPTSAVTTLWENQDVSPPPKPPAGVTMATLIKAAWAHVLWQKTGHLDLTFTQTVNGRSLPLAHADKVLGPCINFIPVRVKIEPSSMTVRDLLQHIQEQHTRSMRHDFVEFGDIVRNATSWPTTTEIQSIVQHQNFDSDYKLPLRGMQSTFSLTHNFTALSELFVFTYPLKERLLVQVCVSTAVMPRPQAVGLLATLCTTIERFARFPDRYLGDLLS